MREKDAEDAARRMARPCRSHNHRRTRDIGKAAARLTPPEERSLAGTGRNGAGTDDTIGVGPDYLKPSGGLLEEDEPGHGVFYMPPVVSVIVSLYLTYTIFIAVLIAHG